MEEVKTKNKKREWWPIGIGVFYLLFVLSFLLFITFANSQKTELVETNYYEKGIQYQQQIDSIDRTKALHGEIRVTYQKEANRITLHFPDSISKQQVKGAVVFFRPSDEDKDFTLPLTINAAGKQIIPDKQLVSGLWRVKLKWVMSQETYFHEIKLIVP